MRHLKLPLIVTGIAVVLAILAGVLTVNSIYHANISRQEKERRAQKGGAIVGVATLVVITPFWLVAAARIGKERRRAKEEAAQSLQH